jgi:Na+-exporting ATPase
MTKPAMTAQKRKRFFQRVEKLVFKHHAITWEWGVVLGCTCVYLLCVESWKAVKRSLGIGRAHIPNHFISTLAFALIDRGVRVAKPARVSASSRVDWFNIRSALNCCL